MANLKHSGVGLKLLQQVLSKKDPNVKHCLNNEIISPLNQNKNIPKYNQKEKKNGK